MMNIKNELHNGVLLFDGATGTMLQKEGLKGSECPETWNLTKADVVKDVHMAYIDAGAQVVTTNTFGANRVKLKEYGLENDVDKINIQAVKIAKEASMGDVLVAASVGPTGKFIEPVGDLSFDDAVNIFSQQVSALERGGADILLVETMMDIKELKAAVIAARDATSLPVFATMTFESNMRTLLGTTPEVFGVVARSLGVSAIGANCSLGIEGIYNTLERLRQVVDLPLIANPNAGIPVLEGEETLFPATPEEMAKWAPSLLELGVRIVGGCCGTTPEHIRKMGDEVREFTAKNPLADIYKPVKGGAVASRSSYVFFGQGNRPLLVGERINPTGRKKLGEEILEGKTALIRKEAISQVEDGADILDVNIGVPNVDEPLFIKKAVFAVNDNCKAPVIIDSSNHSAIEEGLKAVDGKAVVNSVNGEEKSLLVILPLVKKYGASVIGLTLDEAGIPAMAEGRFKIAEKILKMALSYGIHKDDIIIDCLALTVSASQDAAKETLKAIRMVKERLGVSTILGVSNVSFGLPNREVINASFLEMAIGAGLDMAIVNPHNSRIMEGYHASLLLKGFDPGAERFIKRFKAEGEAVLSDIEEEDGDIGKKLFRAIVNGDKDRIEAFVAEALSQGLRPLDISNDALIPGLEEVGRRFDKNIYFLPQVMLSAETMKKAFNILKKELKGEKRRCPGRILMATVEGDVHDIGKNIVSTLLENHGFEVIDLGKNVPADRILDEALKHDVDVVGLSALMTTTVMMMKDVIKTLKENGVKTFTIVGGAVVTQEFAESIGADIYASDAMDAVRKLKALLEEKGMGTHP